MTPLVPAAEPASPMDRIGHVHLRVADLDRAIEFHGGVLGLDVTQWKGSGAAFLGAGGYHHHIGLNTWDSAGGRPPPGHAGLYHTAFLYPDRAALGRAVARVLAAGIALSGMADHCVSEAVYLNHSHGNGVELYRDRPHADWPLDRQGRLAMVNTPLDLASLLAAGRRGINHP